MESFFKAAAENAARAELDQTPMPATESREVASHLREAYGSFERNQPAARALGAGDLVTWAPGLKNLNFPRYGEPAIVIDRLPTPIVDAKMPSNLPTFREPLDLVIGVVRDGLFLFYHVDSRRFAKWLPGV